MASRDRLCAYLGREAICWTPTLYCIYKNFEHLIMHEDYDQFAESETGVIFAKWLSPVFTEPHEIQRKVR